MKMVTGDEQLQLVEEFSGIYDQSVRKLMEISSDSLVNYKNYKNYIDSPENDIDVPMVVNNVSIFDPDVTTPSRPCKREKINLLSPEVCASLDRTKQSTRGATRVLTCGSKAVSIDHKNLTMSKTSVHRYRKRNRKLFDDKIKQSISKDSKLEVHVDGKKMFDIDKKSGEKVERLVIAVTG